MDFYFSLIKGSATAELFHRLVDSVESGLPYPSLFDVKTSSLQALENTSDRCNSRCLCVYVCDLCKLLLTSRRGDKWSSDEGRRDETRSY